MIAAGLRRRRVHRDQHGRAGAAKLPRAARLQIGKELTRRPRRRGEAGGRAPGRHRRSRTVVGSLARRDMVFLTAGLGGGTGTGAGARVAEIAASSGALTVGIVTMPFSFEGVERMENARQGLSELEQHVNSLIVVPNDSRGRPRQNKIRSERFSAGGRGVAQRRARDHGPHHRPWLIKRRLRRCRTIMEPGTAP